MGNKTVNWKVGRLEGCTRHTAHMDDSCSRLCTVFTRVYSSTYSSNPPGKKCTHTHARVEKERI